MGNETFYWYGLRDRRACSSIFEKKKKTMGGTPDSSHGDDRMEVKIKT